MGEWIKYGTVSRFLCQGKTYDSDSGRARQAHNITTFPSTFFIASKYTIGILDQWHGWRAVDSDHDDGNVLTREHSV